MATFLQDGTSMSSSKSYWCHSTLHNYTDLLTAATPVDSGGFWYVSEIQVPYCEGNDEKAHLLCHTPILRTIRSVGLAPIATRFGKMCSESSWAVLALHEQSCSRSLSSIKHLHSSLQIFWEQIISVTTGCGQGAARCIHAAAIHRTGEAICLSAFDV